MGRNEEALANVRRKMGEVIKKENNKLVFGYVPKKVDRKEGERWTDDEGKEWEMKNGIPRSIPKLQDAKRPWWCPECGGPMKNRLDDKFYTIHGSCFDCGIKKEHEMRMNGTYEAWEQKKMRQNEISFLKDTIAQYDDYLQTFSTPKNYFEDGRYEELAPESVFLEQFEKIREDRKILVKRLENLERYEEELAQKEQHEA